MELPPGKPVFSGPTGVFQHQETWFPGLALLQTSPATLGKSLPGARAILHTLNSGHPVQPKKLRPETPPCMTWRADPDRRLALVQNAVLLWAVFMSMCKRPC